MDKRIEREVVRRCREYLYPAAQGASDAEVVAHLDGTLFMLSVRLNVTLCEVFRPVTVPLRRALLRMT